MRKLLAVLVVIALMLGLVGTTSAAAPTTVYLVNTLGIVMDVYVDDILILEDLPPHGIRGPFVGESNREIRINMVVANTVLDPFNGVFAVMVRQLPAGETIAIVARNNNTPGSLGDLNMIVYDFSRTGPGYANLLVHSSLYDESVYVVLSPGTPNEQELPALGNPNGHYLRLPAGSKTALVTIWGRGPLPEMHGPYMTNLRAGKLYVVFIYRVIGELRWLTQEFNVGQ
jgi:hypothetical protein